MSAPRALWEQGPMTGWYYDRPTETVRCAWPDVSIRWYPAKLNHLDPDSRIPDRWMLTYRADHSVDADVRGQPRSVTLLSLDSRSLRQDRL